MAKKTRIEDIDSEAVINSFRLDDTSIHRKREVRAETHLLHLRKKNYRR